MYMMENTWALVETPVLKNTILQEKIKINLPLNLILYFIFGLLSSLHPPKAGNGCAENSATFCDFTK